MEINLWACLDISGHDIGLKASYENSDSFERRKPKLKMLLEGFFAQKQLLREVFP